MERQVWNPTVSSKNVSAATMGAILVIIGAIILFIGTSFSSSNALMWVGLALVVFGILCFVAAVYGKRY